MKFLNFLDRIVRPIAIPNLTLLIIAGQVLFFIAGTADNTLIERTVLVWDQVLAGEVWRLITFFFIPPGMSVIFLLFYCLIFHMMGTALESIWGMVRYNTFLWLGAILTIASAVLCRDQPVTGAFLQGTVFLAFATYNPDFELRLFFVLPVKVKWLAMIQAAGYALAFLGGSAPIKVMVAASIGNYLIFFAPSLYKRLANMKRKADWDLKQHKQGSQPRHTCTTCGVNSNLDPKMDFRYCSKCAGEHAYCEAHLRDHVHVSESNT